VSMPQSGVSRCCAMETQFDHRSFIGHHPSRAQRIVHNLSAGSTIHGDNYRNAAVR
jgi:hypothetical protein